MCHARSAWWLETKSYAPRRIPSRRSVHSTEHKECARLRSRSVAPPSPPHNVLYGGGGRGRGSPKEKLTEFLVPIRWTRFCQTIFWGLDLAKPRLMFLKFGGN